MAAAGMNRNEDLADLLAGFDQPIRMSLHTSLGGALVDSVDTTLGALRYPSAPITFTPCAAGAVVVWAGVGEDEPGDDD